MKKIVLGLILTIGIPTIAAEYVIPIVNSPTSQYTIKEESVPQPPEELNVQFKEIVTGYKFSYAIDEDGFIWSAGRNHVGQLGLNDTTSRSQWTKTETISNVKKVVAGWYHAYAIDSNNDLWVVGDNSKG